MLEERLVEDVFFPFDCFERLSEVLNCYLWAERFRSDANIPPSSRTVRVEDLTITHRGYHRAHVIHRLFWEKHTVVNETRKNTKQLVQ